MAVFRKFLVLLALAAGLAGCERSAAPSFKAIDITGAEYAQGFDLPDADGKRRTLADFAGKVTLVFFGYAQCPDVCPTTLLEIAEVRKALGADGARVQGVLITVDPERDTPEVLKAYVDNFGAGFVALRGSMEETQAVARAFKVYYAKVPGQTAGSYTMDHTAGSYVFDANGKVRLFTRYGSGAEALKHDLQILLAEPPPSV
ncbi:MAG: SCO family protein [Rubrivivax sp.]|nr:SCO family protein [Rubrivivax sp.]